MTAADYRRAADPPDLIETTLGVAECRALMLGERWPPQTVAMFLAPPLCRTPVQVGRWRVTVDEKL